MASRLSWWSGCGLLVRSDRSSKTTAIALYLPFIPRAAIVLLPFQLKSF
ncbi:MAG: hypothetical protein HC852_08195 [Acaryochloridaceae cyanobacterium RU_4_10]|nr:hypothetical protein [Acaryochloridaceae cyanobacterium RU_4_10]